MWQLRGLRRVINLLVARVIAQKVVNVMETVRVTNRIKMAAISIPIVV